MCILPEQTVAPLNMYMALQNQIFSTYHAWGKFVRCHLCQNSHFKETHKNVAQPTNIGFGQIFATEPSQWHT